MFRTALCLVAAVAGAAAAWSLVRLAQGMRLEEEKQELERRRLSGWSRRRWHVH